MADYYYTGNGSKVKLRIEGLVEIDFLADLLSDIFGNMSRDVKDSRILEAIDKAKEKYKIE